LSYNILAYDIEALQSGIYDQAGRVGWNVLDLRFYNMKVARTFDPDGVLFHIPPE